MNLAEIRKRQDATDEAIIGLIAKRLSFADEMAQEKIKSKLQVRDVNREREILSRYSQMSKDKGINPELVVKIFSLLIDESIRLQEKIITKGDRHE